MNADEQPQVREEGGSTENPIPASSEDPAQEQEETSHEMATTRSQTASPMQTEPTDDQVSRAISPLNQSDLTDAERAADATLRAARLARLQRETELEALLQAEREKTFAEKQKLEELTREKLRAEQQLAVAQRRVAEIQAGASQMYGDRLEDELQRIRVQGNAPLDQFIVAQIPANLEATLATRRGGRRRGRGRSLPEPLVVLRPPGTPAPPRAAPRENRFSPYALRVPRQQQQQEEPEQDENQDRRYS